MQGESKRADSILFDSDTKRLLELTASSSRSQDATEEIISIVQRKAPKLLDGLTDSNKHQIANFCHLKLYPVDQVVFNQGDEPDCYYTVIRGAVSIYALPNIDQDKSSSANSGDGNERSKFGRFITQLPPGESFGELSFNGDGDHSRRNAGVISDGHHGEAQILRKQSNNQSSHQNEVDASDVCVLFLIPEKVYMSEMFARHSAKHQTKDKINLLKTSSLFQHWTMDQLVKLAYAMKKKFFEKGCHIIQQGERMEHLWLIKSGSVRISHKVLPPNSIELKKSQKNSSSHGSGSSRKQTKQPITVDIADLGPKDAIGLVESMEESVKKSQRDAVAMAATETFFVPLSFFKQFLTQDAGTLSIVEHVVDRRKKWELLRKEYATKFPKMSMKLPKDAASMSNYAMDGCSSPLSSRKKSTSRKNSSKSQPNTNTVDTSSISPSSRRRRQVNGLMRDNRMNTLDILANEAGF